MDKEEKRGREGEWCRKRKTGWKSEWRQRQRQKTEGVFFRGRDGKQNIYVASLLRTSHLSAFNGHNWVKSITAKTQYVFHKYKWSQSSNDEQSISRVAAAIVQQGKVCKFNTSTDIILYTSKCKTKLFSIHYFEKYEHLVNYLLIKVT